MLIPIPSSPRGGLAEFFQVLFGARLCHARQVRAGTKGPTASAEGQDAEGTFRLAKNDSGIQTSNRKKKCGKKNEKSEKCAHLLIAGSSLASSKVSTTVQQWGNVGSRTSSLQLFGQIL